MTQRKHFYVNDASTKRSLNLSQESGSLTVTEETNMACAKNGESPIVIGAIRSGRFSSPPLSLSLSLASLNSRFVRVAARLFVVVAAAAAFCLSVSALKPKVALLR